MSDTKTGQANKLGSWTPERVAAAAKAAALVIVVGVLLGVFAVWANLYYVGAVIAGALLVVLVAWQFEAALAIYVLVAFVLWGGTPDLATGGSGVGKGVFVSEIMLGFLLAIWFGKYLLGGLPKNRTGSGFYAPIGLYLAYCVLNVVNAYLFWDPHVNRMYQYPAVNAVELGLHFLSGGALVMMATSVSNRAWVTRITAALIAVGALNCANSVLGVVHIPSAWITLLYLMPACYAWAVALDGRCKLIWRIVGLVWVALTTYVLLIKGLSWVSGWLGLMVSLGAMAFLRNRRVFFALLAAACVICLVMRPFLHENVLEASQNEGDYDRFAMMRAAVKYASKFPLGVGLGNYRSYNSFYYGEKWGTTSYTSAHGTYSQHLSEMGFPGLVLFVSILILGFRWMWRSYRAMPVGASKTYVLAAMGQLAGISAAAFLGDYIVPTYHNGGIATFASTVYSWLIWGLAVAHIRITKDEAVGSINIHS